MLNRPGVVTVVGELVAARVAEHVRMRREGQAGESTCARHDLWTFAVVIGTPRSVMKTCID